MNLLRRRFLGSSLIVLGSSRLDALATPLWKWRGTMRLETATLPIPSASNSLTAAPVQFVDVAREAGLTVPNVWGGADFFFQAEDGIRDYKVTGVQTCALPI